MVRGIDSYSISHISEIILNVISDTLNSASHPDSDILFSFAAAGEGALIQKLFWVLHKKIGDALACPQAFVEHGLSLQITNGAPDVVLSEVLHKAKSLSPSIKIPPKYTVHLELDREKTISEGTLMFSLRETVLNKEISRSTFPLFKITPKSRASHFSE